MIKQFDIEEGVKRELAKANDEQLTLLYDCILDEMVARGLAEEFIMDDLDEDEDDE